jgi:hypothetical protein
VLRGNIPVRNGKERSTNIIKLLRTDRTDKKKENYRPVRKDRKNNKGMSPEQNITLVNREAK